MVPDDVCIHYIEEKVLLWVYVWICIFHQKKAKGRRLQFGVAVGSTMLGKLIQDDCIGAGSIDAL